MRYNFKKYIVFHYIKKVTSQRDDFYSKTSKRLNWMRQKIKT